MFIKLKNIVILLIILMTHSSYAVQVEDLVEKTTINLIWIFKDKPQSQHSFIFPHPYIRDLEKRRNGATEVIDIFDKISLWYRLNPTTKINLWYDSALVHDNAVQNTLKKIKNMNLKNINLIDIRNKLTDDFHEFLGEDLPIYFRSDIVRILAGVKLINESLFNNMGYYFAYFDFSIDPINLTKLYSKQETAKKLEDFGIVMGKTESTLYENSFFVMGANNEKSWWQLENALYDALINRNLDKIVNKEIIEEQDVYKDHINLFALLNIFQGRQLYCLINIKWEEFKKVVIIERELSEKDLPANSLDVLNMENRYRPCLKNDNGDLVLVKSQIPYPTRDGISKKSKFNN